MNNHLLFLLMVLSFSAQAQTSVYHSFPDSNAAWSVSYGGYEAPQCYDRFYHISGDTVLHSLNYHKISCYGWIGFPGSSHFCDKWYYYPTSNYFGSIRQDTALRRVYFVPKGDTTEALLYDFNLNIGDTLRTYNNLGGQNSVIVQSIDSVLIGSTYRKRFNLTTPFAPVSIIEGIGSVTGLVEELTAFEFGGNLDCFSQENKQLYPDTNNTCQLILGSNDPIIKRPSVVISPNPFHLTAMLEISGPSENCELELYNIFGKLIRSQKIRSGRTILNREGLPNGVYFYQVIRGMDILATGKLIMQ